MSLKNGVAVIALVAGMIGSVSVAYAEVPTSPMEPLTISRVIAYGQQNQDPLALLTAVRMLNDLGAHVAVPGTETPAVGEQSQPTYDPVALLEEAEGYAAGNTELLAMIETEMNSIESSRWVCYWEYYCDAWGWCNYVEVCY